MRQQKKLPAYKAIHRMTLDEFSEIKSPLPGIYILAYMGKIIYVGKSKSCITKRLKDHFYHQSRIGNWMRCMQFDWHNVRLDIIEPTNSNDNQWIFDAEKACIERFKPLYNNHLLPENPRNENVAKKQTWTKEPPPYLQAL